MVFRSASAFVARCSRVAGVCALLGVGAGCSLIASFDGLADGTSGGGAPPDGGMDAGSSYLAAVLADSPLAYYRLDDVSPAGKAHDSSGNGNDGTYSQGGVSATRGALATDSDLAASFDGTGFVVIGPQFKFAGTAPFSVEAWIKPTLDSNYHDVVSQDDGLPPTAGYLLYVPPPSMGALAIFQRLQRDGGGIATVGAQGSANAFVHLVGVYDAAGNVSIYLNGQQSSSRVGAFPIVGSDSAFVIGAGGGGTNSTFVGVIDEVAVYGFALSADRVATHYAAGANSHP